MSFAAPSAGVVVVVAAAAAAAGLPGQKSRCHRQSGYVYLGECGTEIGARSGECTVFAAVWEFTRLLLGQIFFLLANFWALLARFFYIYKPWKYVGCNLKLSPGTEAETEAETETETEKLAAWHFKVEVACRKKARQPKSCKAAALADWRR